MDQIQKSSIKKNYQLILELIKRHRAGLFNSQYFIPSLLELIEFSNPLDKKELIRLCHWIECGYINLEFYAKNTGLQIYWQNQIERTFDILVIKIKSRMQV